MSQAARILVVDDEVAIRRLLASCLQRSNYRIGEAATAREALATAAMQEPAVVLLDLGLPDRDGLELIPLLRNRGSSIIVVSARDDTERKVAALDLGAADYVTKPFDTEEVLARIRSVLRQRNDRELPLPSLRIGEVELDFERRQVRKGGSEVHLTPREYALLAELAKRPGCVLTHAQLLRAVWGPAHEEQAEYLRVAARSLRMKLENDPSRPTIIRNEPGIGYRLMVEG